MPIRKIERFTPSDLRSIASIIAAVAGIATGSYLLTVFSLPQQLMMLFVMMVLCAFVFMLAGTVRKFLWPVEFRIQNSCRSADVSGDNGIIT